MFDILLPAMLLHFLDLFEWLMCGYVSSVICYSVRWQSNRRKKFPSKSTTCESNWVSNTCPVTHRGLLLCPFSRLTDRKLSSSLDSCHLTGAFIQSDLTNSNCRESLCEKPWNNCLAQGHNSDKIGLCACLVSWSNLVGIAEFVLALFSYGLFTQAVFSCIHSTLL